MGEVEVMVSNISWEEARMEFIGAVFIIENLASFMVDINIIIMEMECYAEMRYFEWAFIIIVRDEGLCIVTIITNIAVY